MLLALAVEECGSESVEAASFCQTCRRVQPQRIAVKAAAGLAKGNLPEKSPRIVVSPYDQRHVFALREELECIESSFEFLVRLNMWIIEKSVHGEILTAQNLQRIDCAGTTANM
jgi:hypothetical protein